jgi:hypothetical protein
VSARQHLERRSETLVGEHHRKEAVRQLAKLGQGDSELRLCGGELALERRVATAELPAHEPDRNAQRQQVLLRTVVKVALDTAALGVSGRHNACPRRTQLVGLALERFERRLEGRVEPRVMESERHLTRELPEDPVLALAERVAIRRTLGDDQA